MEAWRPLGRFCNGGQRQLMAFARALLADPRILILDEATSSVDSDSEMSIQKAMTRLLEGRTSFIIAHPLSTIRHADRIMFFDRGEIVKTGTHEELLALRGHYFELFVTQFQGRPATNNGKRQGVARQAVASRGE